MVSVYYLLMACFVIDIHQLLKRDTSPQVIMIKRLPSVATPFPHYVQEVNEI